MTAPLFVAHLNANSSVLAVLSSSELNAVNAKV